jgi:hypothetical protein
VTRTGPWKETTVRKFVFALRPVLALAVIWVGALDAGGRGAGAQQSGPPTPTPRITNTPTATPRIPHTPVSTDTPVFQVSTPTATPMLTEVTLTPGIITSPTEPPDIVAPLPDTPTATPFPLTERSPTPTSLPIVAPTPRPTPMDFTTGPMPDLVATGMEVTQGIQNLQNEMPLVAHRATAVRVYVRTQDPDVALGDVRGALGGWRDGQFLGLLEPENAPIIARPDGGIRTEIDDSLWFSLPSHWRGAGELQLQAMVFSANPNTAFNAEPDSDNNFIGTTVSFQTAQNFKLRFVHVHLHEPVPGEVDWIFGFGDEVTYLYADNQADANRVALGLLRYFPVATLQWQPAGTVVPAEHWFGEEWLLSLSQHQSQVNSQIAVLKNWSSETKEWLWYGMIDPSADMGALPGGGTVGGIASSGVSHGKMHATVNANAPWRHRGGWLAAHELGHNLGLKHILCGSEGSPDQDFPYSAVFEDGDDDEQVLVEPCSMAAVDPEGYYGFDVYWGLFQSDVDGPSVISNDPEAPHPHRGFPFMSYRNPQWADPFHFCQAMPKYGIPCQWQQLNIMGPDDREDAYVASRMSGHAHAHGHEHASIRSVAQRPAVGTGKEARKDITVEVYWPGDAADDARILNFVPMSRLADETIAEAAERRRQMDALGGENELRFEDSAGNELGRQVLAQVEHAHQTPDDGEEPGELQVITVLLELPEGTERVVLLGPDGAELDERVASDNAPEVDFRDLPDGVLQAPLRLEWDASDADGDDLTYTLLYSRDDGETWRALVHGLRDTHVTLPDFAALPGSEEGRLRIVASDGFHIDEAITGPVTIPDNPPTAVILGPEDGSEFEQHQTVPLLGAAMDLEDGVVAEEGLSWHSSLDGELGTGADLQTRELQVGTHEITLLATDSGGQTDETSIEITIVESDRELLSDDDRREVLRLLGEGESSRSMGMLAVGAGVVLLLGLGFGAGGAVLWRRRQAA